MQILKFILPILIFCEIKAQKLPDLIPYREGNKWGYADSTLQIKIKPQFDYALPFYEGRAIVISKENDQWSCMFIDENGKKTAGSFFMAYPYRNGVAMYVQNKKSYFINKAGKIIYKANYVIDRARKIYPFNESGLAFISPDGHSPPVLIDTTGKIILEASYGNEDTEPAIVDGNRIILYPEINSAAMSDLRGNIIVAKGIYNFIGRKQEADLRPVNNLKGKYGYINDEGKVILALKYDYAREFSEGKAIVMIKNEYHVIDTNGKVLFKIKDVVPQGNFKNGKLKITSGGFKENIRGKRKYADENLLPVTQGLMNEKGKVILEPVYRDVRVSSNGKIFTLKDKYWQLMDTAGKLLSNEKFESDSVHNSWINSNGYSFDKSNPAVVRLNDRYNLITEEGKLLSDTGFNFINIINKTPLAYQYDVALEYDATGNMKTKERGIYKNGFIKYFDKIVFEETGKILYEGYEMHFNDIIEGHLLWPYGIAQLNKGFIDKYGTQYWKEKE